MINPFILRKYTALCVPVFFSAVLFYYCLLNLGMGIWGGILGMVAAIPISVLAGNMLLSNPFQKVLEGKGLLTLTLDSTGVINVFVTKVQNYYLKSDDGQREGFYDRNLIHYLKIWNTKNYTAKIAKTDPEKNLYTLTINEAALQDARFQLFQYPVLIYNTQIQSFITKDWFGNQERAYFANYVIMFLIRKVQELSMYVREFARAVVDTALKPQGMGNWMKWVIYIVIGLAVIGLIWFAAPKIMPYIQSIMGTAKGTFQTAATNAGGIVPRPT